MSRPKKMSFSLNERVQRIKNAGLSINPNRPNRIEADDPLEERVRGMLDLLKTAPVKATHMTFLIMYDIVDNKVRNEVAKYLKQKGCVRIQKSVFLVSAEHKKFEEIFHDLYEVQQYYENNDSIILVPFNTSDGRSMKITGKNIQVETIINKPNTLFF